MQPRRIGFLAFDGVQALDLFGPADAFGSDALSPDQGADAASTSRAPYEIIIIGLGRRDVRTSIGATLRAHTTTDAAASARLRLDTLIIPGGAGLRRAGVAERAATWIAKVAARTRRVASVCTGIYALAPTGLLDGRRVTTHWSAADDIARRFPSLIMESDAIFIQDGAYYTSAGVTAGIDLALALIEADLGGDAALAVAREMVVYLKRQGGQQQFSEALRFQAEASDRFRDLRPWLEGHLKSDLSVERLAAQCCLSPRQFARVFAREFGVTPGAYVEELRLAEAARRLSAKTVPVDRIARSVGYASDDVFRRAFERRFGVSPTTYRRGFNRAATSGDEAGT